jgi:hypothetical protein
MDIVVTTIKQIGREILLDGNSLIGYQHSANLFIKLMKDTSESNPFAGMVLSAYCSSWKSDMPIVCPLQEKEDGAYILLPEGVFDHDGDIYLSLAAIDDNKIVITSNQLTLQVDESNRIVSKVSPSEKYWEIEVLNAMKVWYTEVVNPTFTASEEKLNQLIRRTEEHEEKAEDLQKKAEEQQTAVDQSVASAAQATQTANAAATNANEKAAAANTAAQAANKAKNDADTATSNANKAASDANAAASNANTKAGAAATAASQANAARDSANSIVQTVQQKLDNGEFDGRTTYTGIGDPAVILGKDGDTYLNKSNEGEYPKWLYLKEGGKWIPLWKTQGEDGTDTVPVGAGYVISGDEIPAGYKEATPPFSNPNLLINGDFQVWQRGTTFSIIGDEAFHYTADRWCVYAATSQTIKVDKVAGGIRVSGCAGIIQRFENLLETDVKYALSAAIDGDIKSLVITGGTYTENSYFKYSKSGSREQILIKANGVTTYKYVKLEMGEIATLLIPRLYVGELYLCQPRYVIYRGDNFRASLFWSNAIRDSLMLELLLPSPMEWMPTISVTSGSAINMSDNGTSYSYDKLLFTIIKTQNNRLMIRVNRKDGGGFAVGEWTLNNLTIEIDKEIY